MKKKEKKEKNKEFSLLYDCTAGYRRFLAFALVCVVVMLMANFITPMITAFTVDYVLRGDTSEVNRTLLALSQRLGDRQYFLDRLWLIGLLMIAISVVSGFARFSTHATWPRRLKALPKRCGIGFSAISRSCPMTITSIR